MRTNLVNRKRVDLWIREWEKLHSKNLQKESLYMFIAHKQTEYVLEKIKGVQK